jgi:hypothetical protein
VRPEELDTRPMDEEEVLRNYAENTSLQGRYRVLKSLEGTALGAIRGLMVYRATEDLSAGGLTRYHYPPYVLEGLMHIIRFYVDMRESSQTGSFLPVHIATLHLGPMVTDGEPLLLEGRLVEEPEWGLRFDGRASDRQGRPLMLAQGVTLRRIDA